jgi:mRNA-degrading endonuclease RelE of RelBE toxin-antitoxin system
MKYIKYKLIFAPETLEHLRWIDRKYHRMIKKVLEQQLQYEPDFITLNRKPLEQPVFPGITWELRFGPDNRFRVFYQIQTGDRTVWILAIGTKKKNYIFIGGEEIIL